MEEVFPFSRCANPDCSSRFNDSPGGMFRFYERRLESGLPANSHSVLHLWLCAACVKIYTLESSDGGTVLRLRCAPRTANARQEERHTKYR